MAQKKLSAYQKKRHFERTKEPQGTVKKRKSKEPLFVIQKHDASHLHFDVRLEIGGVLVSWAVPKGPSLDPAQKRLAVRTEDHPMDYAYFEGMIPEGEYGGGTVMVWDSGTYNNLKEDSDAPATMAQSLKKGRIEVELHGKKLQGNFALIRMNRAGKEEWLFIKMRDKHASAKKNPVKTQQKSALTGRTMRQIAHAENSIHHSNTSKKRSALEKLLDIDDSMPKTQKKTSKKKSKEPETEISVGNHAIAISNPEKILFPKDGITKLELVEYYHALAPLMITYIKNHPLMMHRFPDGIAQQGFYQKDAGDYFPSWIKTHAMKKKEGGKVMHVVADSPATIVYLASQACITPHYWLSVDEKDNYPDRLIFDLDPSKGVSFESVRNAALLLRDLLDELGLLSYVMTTGSKGLHVVIPLKPTVSFERIKDFSLDIAEYLVDKYPKELTLEMRKEKRGKKIFIDYLRNSYGATAVVPYAVRALDGAPVATPLQWSEVEKGKLSAQQYTMKNISKRLEKVGDVWLHFKKHAQSIGAAQKKLAWLREHE